MHIQVMIDLETMGTVNNSAIMSLGACKFDLFSGEIFDNFHMNISLDESIKAGFEITAGTIEFWLKQDKEAIEAMLNHAFTVRHTLVKFATWYGEDSKIPVWGNGSTFDNVILRNAYDRMQILCPFDFRTARDTRTIVDLANHLFIESDDIQREGVYHNALDDAVYQVSWLSNLLRKIRGVK